MNHFFFRLGPIASCVPMSADSKPKGAWEWIKTAVYTGQMDYRGNKLDVWEANYTSVRQVLKKCTL